MRDTPSAWRLPRHQPAENSNFEALTLRKPPPHNIVTTPRKLTPHRSAAIRTLSAMASGWDANSSASNASSPIDHDGSDPALWKHLPKLVDGVTKHAITDGTQLVPLYQYQCLNAEVDNILLKNITGPSKPHVRCQLLFEHDQRLPLTIDDYEHGYHLRLSFNKLVSNDLTVARLEFSLTN